MTAIRLKQITEYPTSIVRVMDDGGKVNAIGIMPGGYLSDEVWKLLSRAGREIPSWCGRKARVWEISKGSADELLKKLQTQEPSWPVLTMTHDGQMVGCGRPIVRAVGNLIAETLHCASGADVAMAAYSFSGSGTLWRIEDRPSNGATLFAIVRRESLSPEPPPLPMPTVTVTRRGLLFSIKIVGDQLAVAILAADLHLQYRGAKDIADGIAVTVPCDEWQGWKALLAEAGIPWLAENFDSDADPLTDWGDVVIDESQVPGWRTPVKSGKALHAYQREGVMHILSRGGRALIADEMGLGKTVQTIAAAEAMVAARVLIVAPASVRRGWDNEIQEWGTGGSIQHLRDGNDVPAADTRWLICSYDQLLIRPAFWPATPDLVDALRAAKMLTDEGEDEDEAPAALKGKKLVFRAALPDDLVATLAAKMDPKTAKKWEQLHARLRGALHAALVAWAPDLLVIDEAHRAKNLEAKRTKAVIALSQAAGGCVALSGTPIQNNTNEPAVLLRVIAPHSFHEAHVVGRIAIPRIKGMLKPLMIRRRQEDVLNELPPLTEQVVELQGLFDLGDEEATARLLTCGSTIPSWAQTWSPAMQALAATWGAGKFAGLEIVHAALGPRKAVDPVTMAVIAEVMETRGKAILWTHHHATADGLLKALSGKWRIDVADGRKSADKRFDLIATMERGELDILILGMEAMGEGVNLQYCAATSIFVELAKKSSTIEQCRKRLHRMGQKHPVHAIYLVSDNLVDQFYAELMLYKADLQGNTLDERVRMLGQARGIDPTATVDTGTEIETEFPEKPSQSETKIVTECDPFEVKAPPAMPETKPEKRNATDAATKLETESPAKLSQSKTKTVTECEPSEVEAPPAAPETKPEKRKAGRPRIHASDTDRVAAWRAKRRDENSTTKSPGRPRKYATDAERKAAWRARQLTPKTKASET